MIQSRQKQTRFIKRILRRLKKDRGFEATFHKVINEELDHETGEKQVDIDFIIVDKVILLPSDMQKKFDYDLAYIAANRNFTYGGFFDTAVRKILVDAEDLIREDGTVFTIDTDDYFIAQNRRWQVARIYEYELGTAFFIVGREVDGTKHHAISTPTTESTIQFSQLIGVTKE